MVRILRQSKKFILGFCACGCGYVLPMRNKNRCLSQFKHSHNSKPVTPSVCYICGSDKTHIDKHGWEHWRNHEGKRYCHKCYSKYVYNPIHNKETAKRLYLFLGKQILESKKTRTGVCSKCNKKIGDKYKGWRNKEIITKQTQLHHEFYLTICPWFGRVELCVACHDKLRWAKFP